MVCFCCRFRRARPAGTVKDGALPRAEQGVSPESVDLQVKTEEAHANPQKDRADDFVVEDLPRTSPENDPVVLPPRSPPASKPGPNKASFEEVPAVPKEERGPSLPQSDSMPFWKVKKIHGVNYGNRFIPEDWMKHPYDFFDGVSKLDTVNRVALWDLDESQSPPPRSRMLDWLNATILESHFQEMQRYGVNVVRVPCGYWNWVTYNDDDGPRAAGNVQGVNVAQRLKRLHRIAEPADYQPFFDRIVEFAGKYGIKILFDLHGLPGSQNGEIHSGVCLEFGKKRKTYFEETANRHMAISAVREMAKYASKNQSHVFGVQVVQEPHLQSKDGGHAFLRDYCYHAIRAARDFLPTSVPVILYAWTYDMWRWEHNSFPESEFGTVLWDTHVYHFPEDGEQWTSAAGGLEKAMAAYHSDLNTIHHFSSMQHGRVLVGEFALAGPSMSIEENRRFAKWVIDELDCVSLGSILWNFDHDCIMEWSMQKQAEAGVDWRSLVCDGRHRPIQGPAVFIEAGRGGLWLSAKDDGTVRADARRPMLWEEWTFYHYSALGAPKVALRSSHGSWLSVNESGKLCLSDVRSAWEEFDLVLNSANGQQKVSLQCFHGTWLHLADESGGVLAVKDAHAAPRPGSEDWAWLVARTPSSWCRPQKTPVGFPMLP